MPQSKSGTTPLGTYLINEDIKIKDFAALMTEKGWPCTETSVSRWSHNVPSKKTRSFIEMVTNGAVRAESWAS